MFYVELEPDKNNTEVYKIRDVYNAIVQIEPPLKKDDIIQCYRCQQFGHSKSYCRNRYKCVKCGLDHSTAVCTKPADVKPKCTNCLKEHTD